MRQRGRIGRLQREMMSYAPRPDRQASIHHLAPPPADLKEPERELWRAIVAQRNFNLAACSLLHNGLRMRAIARTAQEVVEQQGMTLPGRYGPKPHPMLRIERNARYLYFQILKSLHVRMEFDEDDFIYR